MLIREAIGLAVERLLAAKVEAPRTDAWLLMSAVTATDRAALIAGRPEPLTPDQEERFVRLVDRRCGREPVAYILGTREFWSLPLLVGPGVLVPRPDSETLVQAALDASTDQAGHRRILDLGTGSGCLLLALLNELPTATGLGIDCSVAALEVATLNAERLGLAERAAFRQGDWGRGLEERFNLIISNPPYVKTDDHAALEPEIRLFEPDGALLAGTDGLDAYRALAPQLVRLLTLDGVACLEIGQGQRPAVAALMVTVGLEMSAIHTDLVGIERCLVLRRPPP